MYNERYLCRTARKIREELAPYKNKRNELPLSYVQINNIAVKVLDDFKLNSYPVGIYQLADKLGFHIYEGDFSNEDTLSLMTVDKNMVVEYKYRWDKIIGLNMNHDTYLQRYLTARSVAYYLLDYSGEEVYSKNCSISNIENDKEKKITYMANCLLMPKVSFRCRWRNYQREGYSIYEILNKMSNMFEVPVWAIQKRYREVFETEIFEEYVREVLDIDTFERKII